VAVDRTAPTITISSAKSGSKFTITFSLSESVIGFAADDVTVTNGTLTNFSGSGTTFTATFEVTNNQVRTISVAAGRFTDAAGNSNTASNTLSFS